MKVIEQLVEHLFREGSIGDSEVKWLRSQGFLPPPTEDDYHEDDAGEEEEYEGYEARRLAALDDFEQEQKQRDLRTKLNSPIHAKARAGLKSGGGGGANRSKHPSPSVQARHQQRIVSESVQSSEELPRRAAILALLNLLISQPPSAHGLVMDTLAAIGSKSVDSCIELFFAIEAQQVMHQPIGADLAIATLKRSALDDYQLVCSLVDRLVRRTNQGQAILLWLLNHVLSDPQKIILLDRLGEHVTEFPLPAIPVLTSVVIHSDAKSTDQALQILDATGNVCSIEPNHLFACCYSESNAVQKTARLLVRNMGLPIVNSASELFGLLDTNNLTNLHFALRVLDKNELQPPDSILSTLERLIVHRDSAISATAATILARYPGELRLQIRHAISEEVAKALSNHRNLLSLDLSVNVCRLTKEVAIWLGRHHGSLVLDTVKSLAPILAKEIAHCPGECLSLNGLKNITDSTAKQLSKFKGKSLVLEGLDSFNLAPNTAKALAEFKGAELRLSGISEISDEIANSLSKFRGRLDLPSWNPILDTPEHLGLLQKLCDTSCDLCFQNLERLTDKQAMILEKYICFVEKLTLPALREFPDTPGHISLASTLATATFEEIKLGRLERIGNQVAKELSLSPYDLGLPSITSLDDSEGHIQLAKKLSQNRSSENFMNLKELSAVAAEQLAQLETSLHLDGLESASDETLEAVSKHRGGELSLMKLSSISDAGAASLAFHEGTLRLGGLTEISDQAARSLCAHKGGLVIVLSRLPSSAASIFRNAGLGIP
jgi:hypothetical protein